MKISRLLDNWGEAGIKTGSSVHRPIDPPAEAEVILRWPDEPMVRWNDRPDFPLCISKQRELAKKRENRPNCYVIENKMVSVSLMEGWQRNAGGENEGIFHYIIENK
jgi:hypothetical protein